jgi:hypothetical protein
LIWQSLRSASASASFIVPPYQASSVRMIDPSVIEQATRAILVPRSQFGL